MAKNKLPDIKNLVRVSCSLCLVTPEQAASWLTLNTQNRPLIERRVQHYAQIMQEGLWEADCSRPVQILNTGLLLNGQHRLTAVIQAGVPVQLQVAVYASPAADGGEAGVPVAPKNAG